MKTTQRVESIHSFFDDYVNPSTRLREFVESYCEAMEFRAQSEKELDAHTETTTLELQSGFAPEAVFQRCYTTTKFKEVQRECSRIGHLHCFSEKVLSDNETEYTFEDRVWCRNKQTKRDFLTQYRRNYWVVYDKATNLVKCECKLFNSSGIMCRLMIKLYDIIRVFEVPEHYILRRWRKDIQRKHSRIKVAYHDPTKTEQVCDYDWLNLWFDRISSRVVIFKAAVHVAAELLEMMEIRVEEAIVKVENELLQQALTRTPSSVGNRKSATATETPASTTTAASKRKAIVPTNADASNEDDTPPEAVGPRVINNPPLPQSRCRTAKRYQSIVEKAVNKLKSRNKGQCNTSGAREKTKQRKGKEAHADESMMLQQSAMVTTRSKSTRARHQEVITNTDIQVSASFPSVGGMPPMQGQRPSSQIAPLVARQALPAPYGHIAQPTFHRPIGLAVAFAPGPPPPFSSTQRVLFPPHVEDHQSSMHGSNSPAAVDVNLKL